MIRLILGKKKYSPIQMNKVQPYKLGSLAVQVHQQDGSLSTAQEKETGVLLDYMTFSSEDRLHHNPLKYLMPCTNHCKIKI